MRLVVDTNVLVPALLNPSGIPARLLEWIQAGGHTLLFDARILDGYYRVLNRPEFAFSPGAVAVLLSAVPSSGLQVDALPLAVRLPDADDLAFLEVAAAGLAGALITGNACHFAPIQGAHRIRVVSPREALELLAESGR
ncbi:hypothetical protein BH23GEM5_BH23GEM5_02170 [soil metagenome]